MGYGIEDGNKMIKLKDILSELNVKNVKYKNVNESLNKKTTCKRTKFKGQYKGTHQGFKFELGSNRDCGPVQWSGKIFIVLKGEKMTLETDPYKTKKDALSEIKYEINLVNSKQFDLEDFYGVWYRGWK